jgi:hypothetical protein
MNSSAMLEKIRNNRVLDVGCSIINTTFDNQKYKADYRISERLRIKQLFCLIYDNDVP